MFSLDNLLWKFNSNKLFEQIKDLLDFSKNKKKKDKEDMLFWESPMKFNWKFVTTWKIVWDYMIPLSPKNKAFHMASYNQEAENFYEKFISNKYNNELKLESIFSREIEKFNKYFCTPKWTTWVEWKKKKLVFNVSWSQLKNRTERGNICTYDYIKGGQYAWKLIFYIFNNDELKPIDIITVNKLSDQIRTDKDIKVDFWLLAKNPSIMNNISHNDWTLFYPFVHVDLNLYPIDNYLKELYHFFYYMTFSLFFRKNEKLKNYYKSNIIDLHNIASNLLDDVEIREDIKWTIKNRDWYPLAQSLNKLIPWNIDVTYYYCFMSIKQQLYPCYLKVDSVNETEHTIEINVTPSWWTLGLSHGAILNIFKRINALEPKSFVYENLTDFNVKKDVWFLGYQQLDIVENLIKWYKMLFNS